MTNYKEFYQGSLIPDLSRDVLSAEMARQRGDHKTIDTFAERWGVYGPYPSKMVETAEQRAMRESLRPELDLIKVGLAGLGRIVHVDTNSAMKTRSQSKRVGWLERIDRADDLYMSLVVSTLVPWSIHGGSLFWIAEIAQDKANTEIILGNEQKARDILRKATQRCVNIKAGLKDKIIWTDDEALKQTNYPALVDKKTYLGALSSQGVLFARIAKMDHNLALLSDGLVNVSQAYQYEKNPHRLATLSVWTLESSYSPGFEATPYQRILAVLRGTKGIIKAYFDDPGAAKSALAQFKREH